MKPVKTPSIVHTTYTFTHIFTHMCTRLHMNGTGVAIYFLFKMGAPFCLTSIRAQSFRFATRHELYTCGLFLVRHHGWSWADDGDLWPRSLCGRHTLRTVTNYLPRKRFELFTVFNGNTFCNRRDKMQTMNDHAWRGSNATLAGNSDVRGFCADIRKYARSSKSQRDCI